VPAGAAAAAKSLLHPQKRPCAASCVTATHMEAKCRGQSVPCTKTSDQTTADVPRMRDNENKFKVDSLILPSHSPIAQATSTGTETPPSSHGTLRWRQMRNRAHQDPQSLRKARICKIDTHDRELAILQIRTRRSSPTPASDTPLEEGHCLRRPSAQMRFPMRSEQSDGEAPSDSQSLAWELGP
jgi:hypothetical protein